MITLPNNFSFEFMTASGALGYDGYGWPWEKILRMFPGIFNPHLFVSVTKTLTLNPREGNFRWYNPFSCIRFLPNGTLNAVGLTNKGFNWWLAEYGKTIDSEKIPLVVSILGDPLELKAMAILLRPLDIIAIEINASCPNTGSDILENTEKIIESCKAVRSATQMPVILKLSVAHEIELIVPRVRGFVNAFSINSVPWKMIFPDQKSPLEHLGGGGVSGKIAQPYTWAMIERLKRLSDIPVIGPSVWDFKDIETLKIIGADAISFGSIFLRYPWRPTMFVLKQQNAN
ncbi:MAG: hypothetical protein NTW46_00890 [Candidatus Nealsonbacteria bacterium]|nr:hypothetical protein [Candidatus Nealsonbacteria bacterium]